MASYQLTVNFSPEDVKLIRGAGQQVMIIRQAGPELDTPPVVWLAFDPFGSNSIEWDEAFGLYAGTAEFEDGAKVYQLSALDSAAAGKPYVFQNGVIGDGGGAQEPARRFAGAPDAYQIANYTDGGPYVFGLTQRASVGGKAFASCLNAVMVLKNERVLFRPQTTLWVCLGSGFPSGSIAASFGGPLLGSVLGKPLKLSYTGPGALTVQYGGGVFS
jgi:hypothetical protein